MNIAVAISGQYRTFQTAWQLNHDAVAASCESNGWNVDFYVDTWRQTGATDRAFPGYRRQIGQAAFDPYIYTWQSGRFVSVDAIQSVIPGAIATVHDYEINDVISQDVGLSRAVASAPPKIRRMVVNSAAMFYLMKLSMSRICQSPRHYDLVLRARPDWVWRRNLLEELVEIASTADLVFFDSSPSDVGYGYGYVTDVCFGGSLETMTFMSRTFDWWVDYVTTKGWNTDPLLNPGHKYFPVSESALSLYLKDWRKSKVLQVAAERAGYILRDDPNVLPIRRFSSRLALKQLRDSLVLLRSGTSP